ncbi:MAG TPA: Ig-like domain-containing protein [Gemmataceae bacterium]|nr:Ig-like domain-containing protein [Gemmataceae bacterium]
MVLTWCRKFMTRRSGISRARGEAPRRRPRRFGVEQLEGRIAPASVQWIGASGDWGTAANWQDTATLANRLPGAGDDALINVAGITVTHSTGADTVKSLTANDDFVLSGGTLSVTGNLQEQNGHAFSLSGGTLANATVKAGTVITATVFGGTLNAITLNGILDLTSTFNVNATVTGGLTVGSGGLVEIGNNTVFSGQLNFDGGSQTLGGSGTVVFGTGSGNYLRAGPTAGSALTIGPGILIHGYSGVIGYNPFFGGPSNVTFTNQGTVNADGSGGNLMLGGTNWTSSGVIQASGGGTVSLNGSWSNSGTITSAAGSTLALGGAFATSTMGTIVSTGGVTNLTGTLANSGSTLNLNAATGSWLLDGGTIDGGTVATAPGTALIATVFGGSLANGVTLNGILDLTTTFNVTATVTGGLTLGSGSVVQLGSNNGIYAQLNFDGGSQTLGGSGTVVFGTGSNNYLRAGPTAGSFLTIGPNVLIHGHSGTLGYAVALGGPADVTFTNQGTIRADVAGGTILLDGDNWTNSGTVQGSNGGSLVLASTATTAPAWTSSTTLSMTDGTLTLHGKHWSTAGINLNNSTLNLGDLFSYAELGSVTRTGGTVNLTGTLANSGSTLNLNAGTGSWLLDAGTIDGGAVATSGSATLVGTVFGGTFANDVTLDGVLDLTTTYNVNVTVTGGLTLGTSSVVQLGSNTGIYGQLNFDGGKQTLAGSGSILFGDSINNLLRTGPTAGSALTIAPGILIHGHTGTVGYAVAYGGSADVTFTNQGTIRADVAGGTIFLDGNNWTNSGTLQGSNGGSLVLASTATTAPAWTSSTIISMADGTLTLHGSHWSTAGINLNNSTLNLGDLFSYAEIGTLTRAGGTVNLMGTLANSGGTLSLNAATGSWLLDGGTIDGGTVATSSGAALVATVLGGTLANGVTLNGILDLTAAYNVNATVTGGLTLGSGSVVQLGSNNGIYAQLNFDGGSQTLGGSGSVLFGSSGSNFLSAGPSAGSALSIGPGILIHGQAGAVSYSPIYGGSTNVSLTNQGTIAADGGGTIVVAHATNFSGGTLTGGTWQVAGNSTLVLSGGDITTNAANIVLDGANANFYSDTNTSALSNFALNSVGGQFTLDDGRNFTAHGAFANAGSLIVAANSTFSAPSGLTQTTTGSLTGTGVIAADVTSDGQVNPGGAAPGVLTINGSYTQTASGGLNIKLGGTTVGTQHDQLAVTGTATLDGALNISLINGFTPGLANEFTVLTFQSRAGAFAHKNGLAFNGGVLLSIFHLGDFTLGADLVPAADSQSVTVNQDTPAAISLTGADPENEPLTFTVTTAPGHGTLSGTAPALTYTPNAGYHGADSFQFKVNDSHQDSALATVAIAVDGRPTANGQALTTNQDIPVAITLTGSDPENETLAFLISASPVHGTLTGTGPNLTYMPANGYHGGDSFQFKVNDGRQDSANATVSLVVDGKPAANAQSLTLNQDTPSGITLTGSDPENETLTFIVTANPNHGTLSGTAANLTYTPASGYHGADSFQFKVNDGHQDSDLAGVSLFVDGKPSADALSVTTNQDTAAAIVLTGSDPENEPLTFVVIANPAHGTLSGTAPNLTYIPAAGYHGPDSFQFKVNDGHQDSAAANVALTVDGKPTAIAQSLAVTQNGLAQITLTGSDPENEILSFVVTANPSHGTLSGTAPNLTYTPDADYLGTDSFQFKVNDGHQDSAVANVSINVINGPVANAQSIAVNQDTQAAITLTGADPKNEPLTFTVTSDPSHGTLSGTAPNLLYTPAAGYHGPDSFQFKVSDSVQDSDVATVSIFVDGKPSADAQSMTTTQDTPADITLTGADPENEVLTFIVTAGPTHGALSGTAPNLTYTPAAGYHGADSFQFKVNDGHQDSEVAAVSIFVDGKPSADSQSLTTNQDTAASIALTGSDPENESLAFIVTAPPSHGTLSGTAPNVTYTPAAGYHGADNFQFKVNDGRQDSAVASISLTVDGRPTADTQSLTTNQDTAATIVLTGSDPENELLSFIVTAAPSHGTLSGTAPNLTYTPATDYHGADSFQFKANDGRQDSDVATVSIAVDGKPTADTQSLTSNQDTPAGVTLTGSDPENETLAFTVTADPFHGTLNGTAPNLTYTPAPGYHGEDSFEFLVNDGHQNSDVATVSIFIDGKPTADTQSVTTNQDTAAGIALTGSDPENETLTFIVSADPNHGTLSGTAPNLTYTPAAGYHGADSFQFKVNDGHQDSAVASVSITVDGRPAADTQSLTTNQDAPAGITLTGSDPENEALAFTVTADPLHGTLNGTAPQLTYTPAPGYHGADSFEFLVNDGHQNSTVAAVSIFVDGKPTADAQSVTTNQDTAASIALTGSDPENETLTFIVSADPSHGTLSGTAPNFRYTPAAGYHGPDGFQFKVNDGHQDSDIATVSITVDGRPTADTKSLTTNQDTPAGVTLTGSDPENEGLTFTVTANPSHGTLSGTIPNLTYTPASGYHGADSFQFKVNDGRQDSAVAMVSITVTAAENGIGRISGAVFLDYNANGIQDTGEPGLASAAVFLDTNNNGSLDPGEISAKTDTKGQFTFTNLAAGAYAIRESVPTSHGIVQTAPVGLTYPATVAAGSNLTGRNFGDVLISTVSPVEVNTTIFPSSPDAATAFVRGLYRNLLGRDAEPTGLDSWTSLLRAGGDRAASRAQVVAGIWNSREHRGLQVDHYYATFLNRPADPAGRASHVQQFLAGASEADVIVSFVLSMEYQTAHAGMTAFVKALYTDVLSRGFDANGLQSWEHALQGESLAEVARQFISSDESFLRAIDGYYAAFLHRAGEESGRQFWLDQLRNGRNAAASAREAFSFREMAERFLAGDDAAQEYFAAATAAARP